MRADGAGNTMFDELLRLTNMGPELGNEAGCADMKSSSILSKVFATNMELPV